MKGIRFYLEYPSKKEKNKATVKNLGKHEGNCIAVFLGKEHTNPNYSQECVLCSFHYPNGDVNLGGISQEYLRERCKRIPEHVAKEIHPRLSNHLLNNL